MYARGGGGFKALMFAIDGLAGGKQDDVGSNATALVLADASQHILSCFVVRQRSP
jgi:hypothetical protein